MRPILGRRHIDVLNGDPNHGVPLRIELQLCGPSDSKVAAADDPIVIVYSADDDPYPGDELRLPLAALKEFIDSSAELLQEPSPSSTHTSDEGEQPIDWKWCGDHAWSVAGIALSALEAIAWNPHLPAQALPQKRSRKSAPKLIV